MISLLTSLLALSFLVFIHEFGHFIAAKKMGIEVEEFGFGYPPKIWGKKIGRTLYSLNLIPFGGFIRVNEERFAKEPKRVQAPVLFAGILMNFLLAVFLFSLIYSFLGIPKKQDFVRIIGVAGGSPAEKAGMQKDDIVRRLKISAKTGELKIETNKEFVKIVKENLGRKMEFEIDRQGKTLSIGIIPRKNPPEGEGALGVVISDSKIIKPVFWQRPFLSLWWGTKEAVDWVKKIFWGVGLMFYNLLFKGVVPKDVAGPIGVVQMTARIARTGILALLQFIGILSVNLAVLNFLPIPALDGGRLLFLGIEVVTGRRPKPKVEKWIHAIGMAVLLLLMLAITVQDIRRILGISPSG